MTLSPAATFPANNQTAILPPLTDTVDESQQDDPGELRAALATIDTIQKDERNTATQASTMALDRVIANAMVLMGVTLSSGFAAWTSSQFSDNSPNNTATTQIGSLALLASLSLGAATMFTSAMHLDIMSAAFRTILSLKETKINGLAVDNYRKRRNAAIADETGLKAVGFTQGTVPLAEVGLGDFFAASRLRGWTGLLGLLVLGPAYALLPRMGDHDRKSAEVDFDFKAEVGTGTVVITTRATDSHAKRKDGTNVEPINVCFRAGQTEDEKEIC
jgi:hypothetical protein